MFSYAFLTAFAFCVFINSDIFYDKDQLRHLKSHNFVRNREKRILKKGDNSLLGCNFEMQFKVIQSGISVKVYK